MGLPRLRAERLYGNRRGVLAPNESPGEYLQPQRQPDQAARRALDPLRHEHRPAPDHRFPDKPRRRPVQLRPHLHHRSQQRRRNGRHDGELPPRRRVRNRAGFPAGVGGDPHHGDRILRAGRLEGIEAPEPQYRPPLRVHAAAGRSRRSLGELQSAHRQDAHRRRQLRPAGWGLFRRQQLRSALRLRLSTAADHRDSRRRGYLL